MPPLAIIDAAVRRKSWPRKFSMVNVAAASDVDHAEGFAYPAGVYGNVDDRHDADSLELVECDSKLVVIAKRSQVYRQ